MIIHSFPGSLQPSDSVRRIPREHGRRNPLHSTDIIEIFTVKHAQLYGSQRRQPTGFSDIHIHQSQRQRNNETPRLAMQYALPSHVWRELGHTAPNRGEF